MCLMLVHLLFDVCTWIDFVDLVSEKGLCMKRALNCVFRQLEHPKGTLCS